MLSHAHRKARGDGAAVASFQEFSIRRLACVKKASMERHPKSQYTAAEAAGELGVSLRELTSMIQTHILRPGENMSSLASSSFQPSDIVIPRLLSTGKRALAMPHSP